jgi:hypothetical protein
MQKASLMLAYGLNLILTPYYGTSNPNQASAHAERLALTGLLTAQQTIPVSVKTIKPAAGGKRIQHILPARAHRRLARPE